MLAKKIQGYRHLPAFILLFLAKENAHGGAIYTSLKESIPSFDCDSGAIYRTLQNLEDAGEVTCQWDTTGSGPARKIYMITELGWEALKYWREDIEKRLKSLNYFISNYDNLKR